MDHSVDMLRRLDEDLASEQEDVAETEQSAENWRRSFKRRLKGSGIRLRCSRISAIPSFRSTGWHALP